MQHECHVTDDMDVLNYEHIMARSGPRAGRRPTALVSTFY